MEDGNGDYVRLEEDSINARHGVHGESVPPDPRNGEDWKRWAKLIASCILLGVLLIVIIKWVGPLLMKKVVIPVIKWEMETFSAPGLAVVIFASMAIFPVVLLPSTPSMWVAGMTFGYVIGFLIVIAGVAVGVTLPYFIGSLFHSRIHGWLEKHPKQASIFKLAGEGDWFHQFQAITLIRISPFPYTIFNYAVVATDARYSPYLLGSLVGLMPDIFVALYSGILIHNFADATQDKKALSVWQIIFDVVGFSATVTASVIIGIYTTRRLNQKQEEELILE